MNRASPFPVADADELPTAYAERVGRWYAASVSVEHKKRLGQYMTSADVARFMASLWESPASGVLRILDPGAGAGILSCAISEHLAASLTKPAVLELVTYETDGELADCLIRSLEYLSDWLLGHAIALQFIVRRADFILAYAAALDDTPKLFDLTDETSSFDIVIANPPYFKLPKSDPRACAAEAVVYGQPNIYALFMAIAAKLLRPDGQFVFITPRSYTAGPYFRRFREQFFAGMRPETIHLFDSRRDAFSQDEVLQENIILAARRADGWSCGPDGKTVRVSASAGAGDLARRAQRAAPLREVLDMASRDKVLRIPTTMADEVTADVVRGWGGSLRAYGLQISTGPVVAFRAVGLLHHTGDVSGGHAPLLWMQNVHPMQVRWPVTSRGKEQYIASGPASASLLLPDKNYVLLRRFSAKEQDRRLTAAPLLAGRFGTALIGLENHLNYIHRLGGELTTEETYGLAVLLNSTLLDDYFCTFNGNTQVSATELRALPLPSLGSIIEMGRRAMTMINVAEYLDILVNEVLGISVHHANLISAERI